APELEDPSGLGARRNLQLLVPVEGLEREPGPQGRLGHGDVHGLDQIEAVPLEPVMGPDHEVDVEVARRPAAGADGTPAGQTEGDAVVHAGGHVDLPGPGLAAPPVASAVDAGAAHLLPQSATALTGGGGDDLAEDGLAHPADLPGAVAGGAAGGGGTGPGAAARAGGAG